MKKIVLALATLGFTGPALAQDMTVEDANGDGVYSMEELQAAYPDLTEDQFKLIDANADGSVDADELAAAQEAGTLAQ